MQDTIKVIVKWEGGKNGNPILFMPQVDAKRGYILCYAHMGQHSEACLTYYWGLRNPAGKEQLAAVDNLLNEYANMTDDKIVIVKRDTVKMRKERESWYIKRQ